MNKFLDQVPILPPGDERRQLSRETARAELAPRVAGAEAAEQITEFEMLRVLGSVNFAAYRDD